MLKRPSLPSLALILKQRPPLGGGKGVKPKLAARALLVNDERPATVVEVKDAARSSSSRSGPARSSQRSLATLR